MSKRKRICLLLVGRYAYEISFCNKRLLDTLSFPFAAFDAVYEYFWFFFQYHTKKVACKLKDKHFN